MERLVFSKRKNGFAPFAKKPGSLLPAFLADFQAPGAVL